MEVDKTKFYISPIVLSIAVIALVYFSSGIEVEQIANAQIDAVKQYETIELKNQSDFKLSGEKVFIGSGTEPGFKFLISFAGTKFGADLLSQYGDTHYVGFLDLTFQTTSTKVFSGKLLDKSNNPVDAKFEIVIKKCLEASGSSTPLTVSIKVGNEKLSGCSQLLIQ